MCKEANDNFKNNGCSLSQCIDKATDEFHNKTLNYFDCGLSCSLSAPAQSYNPNAEHPTWGLGCSCDSIYNKDWTVKKPVADKSLKHEEERLKTLSYIQTIIANNCIVLASDSRSVERNQDGLITDFSDGFQKIAYLEKSKLGIAYAGLNHISCLPITEFLKNIDRTFSKEKSVKDRLQYFLNVIISKLPIDENIEDKDAECLMNIHCGGYDQINAVAFSVDILNNTLMPQIHKTDFICCAGYDQSALKLFENPKSKGNSLAKLSNLNTMLEFSDYMVRTEIERAKYINGIPPVGDPIQTLLLTPDGKKWIHTLY